YTSVPSCENVGDDSYSPLDSAPGVTRMIASASMASAPQPRVAGANASHTHACIIARIRRLETIRSLLPWVRSTSEHHPAPSINCLRCPFIRSRSADPASQSDLSRPLHWSHLLPTAGHGGGTNTRSAA